MIAGRETEMITLDHPAPFPLLRPQPHSETKRREHLPTTSLRRSFLCASANCQSPVITDRQHGQILGINGKATSTFTHTFLDNTNDKSQHRFPLKCSMGKDQAVLQPRRPAQKLALQHHASRRRTPSTARC